jgi:glycosyltransferase involved in cell wall biosynthesis
VNGLQETPLVSVIIPTYNRHELVFETIESVISQTYRNTEVIVVSDGYDDVLKTALQDKKFKKTISFFEINHTGNPARARNVGIYVANGDFIAFCDDDDLWRADKLELQMTEFIKCDACLCYSNMSRFNEKGQYQAQSAENTFHAITFKDLLYRNTVPVSSILIKKQYIRDLGEFEESLLLGGSEDFEFLLRWRFNYPFVHINENLVMYRSGDNRMTPIDGKLKATDTLKYLCNIFMSYYFVYRKTNAKLGAFIKPYFVNLYRAIKMLAYNKFCRKAKNSPHPV